MHLFQVFLPFLINQT